MMVMAALKWLFDPMEAKSASLKSNAMSFGLQGDA